VQALVEQWVLDAERAHVVGNGRVGALDAGQRETPVDLGLVQPLPGAQLLADPVRPDLVQLVGDRMTAAGSSAPRPV
jgi:hypothetical protein